MDTCRTCKLWVVDERNEGIGNCRRYAPAPYISGVVNATSPYKVESAAIWPHTLAVDWCAEYLPDLELAELDNALL